MTNEEFRGMIGSHITWVFVTKEAKTRLKSEIVLKVQLKTEI